jgi:hypothetical protein
MFRRVQLDRKPRQLGSTLIKPPTLLTPPSLVNRNSGIQLSPWPAQGQPKILRRDAEHGPGAPPQLIRKYSRGRANGTTGSACPDLPSWDGGSCGQATGSRVTL